MSDTQPDQSWKRFRKLARNRPMSILCCALVAFVVGALFSLVRMPVPKVHDEFSYLLAADTFSAGRLANPTHPMWEHFETFHVIQKPSYASKYQPGQGMMLALGQLFCGLPIVGAWIASALAAGAVCWMLQGWVPSRWALLGGLLVALHGVMQVRWSLSFWGGNLPMAGGALMLGALPRIKRRPTVSASLLLATGAIVLAATRPFEGFVLGMTIATALVMWMFGARRSDWVTVISEVIIPSTAVLFLGLAALGYYNLRVTGDPLRMPYQVHESQYGYSPLFLWQSPDAPPEYRHEVMRDFQTGWAIEDYQQQQTLVGWIAAKAEGLRDLIGFFCAGPLWLPLLVALLFGPRRLRFVWVTLAAFLIAQLTVPWLYPHYFAPAAPLVFLLIVIGLRYLRALPRLGYTRAQLVVPLVGIHFGTLPLLFVQYARWQPAGWEWNRAQIAEKLEQTPGKHLVLVTYVPEHIGHAEWVYNRANIDAAKIVWARPMDTERNAKLLNYFNDHTVWTVNGDAEKPELVPYRPNSDEGVLSVVLPNQEP